MIRIGAGAVAGNLSEDRGLPRPRVFQRLDDEHGRTLRRDEAVAIGVEGTAGSLRFIVSGRHRAHDGECPQPELADSRLGTARQHHLSAPIAD